MRMKTAVGISILRVNVAMMVAIALLRSVEYAALAVVYFLTEVPLLLGIAAVHRRWRVRSELAPCKGMTP
jgi:hypothetical protein